MIPEVGYKYPEIASQFPGKSDPIVGKAKKAMNDHQRISGTK